MAGSHGLDTGIRAEAGAFMGVNRISSMLMLRVCMLYASAQMQARQLGTQCV